ncbi:hypothetical protein EVA_18997 [gut metagenome]|uniref:Uncharacterized protein n=1 Tax=gut metagenome TaxID=749906 RepID=J9FTK3_9ZZZZ
MYRRCNSCCSQGISACHNRQRLCHLSHRRFPYLAYIVLYHSDLFAQ